MRRLRRIARLVVAAMVVAVGAVPASSVPQRAAPEPYSVPRFREAVPEVPKPDLRNLGAVRFLADVDFPPFSYLDAKGALAGFSVELADAVCRELQMACEFAVKPWSEVSEAIERGEGDAVIAGIRMTAQTAETFDFTRPYYRPLARFAVRLQFDPKEPYPRSLAGKRLGVMAGSTHEAWLKEKFTRSNIRPYATQAEALEALRTGGIDALFDDAARLMFWLASPGSRGCCRLADGAYVDEDRFSPALTIAVKRGNEQLLEALDYGLDRLQENGAYAAIFRRHFPMSPW